MLKIDRAHYVPTGHPSPYRESAVPIGINVQFKFNFILLQCDIFLGFNATLSAPHMVNKNKNNKIQIN